jgi:hypothetical protein
VAEHPVEFVAQALDTLDVVLFVNAEVIGENVFARSDATSAPVASVIVMCFGNPSSEPLTR